MSYFPPRFARKVRVVTCGAPPIFWGDKGSDVGSKWVSPGNLRRYRNAQDLIPDVGQNFFFKVMLEAQQLRHFAPGHGADIRLFGQRSLTRAVWCPKFWGWDRFTAVNMKFGEHEFSDVVDGDSLFRGKSAWPRCLRATCCDGAGLRQCMSGVGTTYSGGSDRSSPGRPCHQVLLDDVICSCGGSAGAGLVPGINCSGEKRSSSTLKGEVVLESSRSTGRRVAEEWKKKKKKQCCGNARDFVLVAREVLSAILCTLNWCGLSPLRGVIFVGSCGACGDCTEPISDHRLQRYAEKVERFLGIPLESLPERKGEEWVSFLGGDVFCARDGFVGGPVLALLLSASVPVLPASVHLLLAFFVYLLTLVAFLLVVQV